MKNAKMVQPELVPELTPELEAMLEESEAQIDRGEYVEIEMDDDDDVPTVMAKLREAFRRA